MKIKIGRVVLINTLCCVAAILLAWNARITIRGYPFFRDFAHEFIHYLVA